MAIYQVNPAENYPISRVLIDSTDSTLYYPQAKVYDDVSGDLLATVDLAFVATRRYMTLYKIPYDNLRRDGRYITIIVTVYTDSGHTTKSELYYDEVQQLVVQQKWNPSMISVAGTNSTAPTVGGISDGDHERIEKMLRKILEEVKQDPQKPVDVRPLHNSIIAISKQINAIKTPEGKEVDLSGVENSLRAMVQEVRSYGNLQTKEILPMVRKLEELGTAFKVVMDSVIAPLQKENLRLRTLLEAVSPDFAEQAMAKKKKARLDALMAKYNR